MEWYKDFYEEQFKWLQSDKTYNMEALMDQLVTKVKDNFTGTPKRILELGGGSGQFAVAAAKQGYDVTVIELSPSAVEHMKVLAKKHHVEENLHIIQGDFYKVELDKKFDVICYWDGFGIGSDADQHFLLKRISNWLTMEGVALIDIYTPWYWAKAKGQKMQFENYVSHYDFDAYQCRMINTCWLADDESQKITQTLRCYSPADLILLAKNLNLRLVDYEPAGEMDYENWEYNPNAPLERAMTFMAVLKREV
ncbi:class I SAM-dependent methyltransferase [Ornithinibacillus halophilus]|uniref:Methyltransferase domain-containing protein n=1 Tax=Ornithinibacillus halophilus TaxID=930117 RepID=A0A1M5LJY1_9BACI|nr:class I SAM-dependent methyltransferase [Ornithinibacillus halophilus]SHG64673.1 Methyltransferase domain-containing protein [Ornithinibacillus halophilus]